MQINFSSGNHDIVASGQTFLFGNAEDLTIDIVADNNFSFSVVLRFLNDSSTEMRIEQELVGDTFILSCINFDDQGTGLAQPANIATIDGKILSLMFWSYLEGKEHNRARSVKYTLFFDQTIEEQI